ncbi:gluconate 2-dehydrogenase subunit 3 family protein [Salicibibacter cibarius]|uniref:Gluconate 2-dehydrogenase subunit 3 family protein n=1 Tax=Salicibibacter cibarius TaxID=2743000 RepID=A0A7T7CB86_9BACI|nr:gluconate 2-dehydrogenase subunit 3 family protein [Salicibibacter cibarius]QQK75544.1 gluconate 2-dehydrogenase subunit 3 family protein [Salicibibacter cibarius]
MADENEEQQTKGLSRRQFLKNSGYVVGGAVGGGLLGGVFTQNFIGTTDAPDTATEGDTTSPEQLTHARMFFKRQEDFDVLSAAVERIFPDDETGPGAISLGVPYFIDKQLAGEYGFNSREYMQGPFFEGAPTQGPQSGMLRRGIFLGGVRTIQNIAQNEHGESYFDLEPEVQDEILEAFEDGEVDMTGVASDEFFAMLRTATIEGAYSDPVYGGNYNMDGWRQIQYPGSQMAYTDVVAEEEFVEMDPVSLHDHHE